MQTIPVSLGWRCHIAKALRQLGLRNASFPFDWTMIGSLNEITEIIKTQFKNFLEVDYNKNLKIHYSIHYKSIIHPHWDQIKNVEVAMQRRVERLIKLLGTNQHLTFIRHTCNMHRPMVKVPKTDNPNFEEFLIDVKRFMSILENYSKNYSILLLWDDAVSQKPTLIYEDVNLKVFSHKSWDAVPAEKREARFREFLLKHL